MSFRDKPNKVLTIKENNKTTAEASELGRTGIFHEALEGSSDTNETSRSLQQSHHARHEKSEKVDKAVVDASQRFKNISVQGRFKAILHSG